MSRAGRAGNVSVLESRLRVPRALPTTVLRTRLLDSMAFAEAQGRTTIVISAPAGAGKTVLLGQRSEQLRSAGSTPAWLAIDEADNDPRRLWAGILAACVQALSDTDGAAPAELVALQPPENPADTGFLAAWQAAAEPADRPLWLILDDVHALSEPPAIDGLARLLRTAPPWLRLMLGSRQDLPLPIPRMILAGLASEIRAADLAFDEDEARQLLSSHSVEVGAADLRLLLVRTEGWAAGLKLAALSLNHQEDVSSSIAAFAGDSRPVADYLVHEVLARLPADIRNFLLVTAVPEQLTADLADELTGRVDSGSVLDRLAHDNVFTSRHDSSPQMYHYHPLLRSYLLAELSRHDAHAIRRLHARIARWFAIQDLPATAMRHAVAAADWTSVSDLLDRHGLRLVLSGELEVVLQVLASVPDRVLADPGVALVGATAALHDGNLAAAQRHLERVGRHPARHAEPRRRLLHVATLIHEARLRGDRSPLIETLIAQTRTDSTSDIDVTLLATANRGMMLTALGDCAAAQADLDLAERLARKHHRDLLALDCLSQLALTGPAPGNATGMLGRAHDTIEFAAARGWSSAGPMVRGYLAAAWGAWEEMDVAAAQRWADRAAEIAADVEPATVISAEILAAYVCHARSADARELVDRLRKVWRQDAAGQLTRTAVAYYCLTDLRTALSIGETGWTTAIVARARQALGESATDVGLLEAMVDAHHDRFAAVRERLTPAMMDHEPHEAAPPVITYWLLQAELADASDQPARARNALLHALEAAAPLRAIRPIVSAPRRVRRLLLHQKGRFGQLEGFVGDVVEAARHHVTSPERRRDGNPLTARELDLLRNLESQLSVNEIAQSQSVSVNTVKTHLKALYRKFDVGSRRAAVERGREWGLL